MHSGLDELMSLVSRDPLEGLASIAYGDYDDVYSEATLFEAMKVLALSVYRGSGGQRVDPRYVREG